MVNCRYLVQCQQHLHSLSLGENLSKLHHFFFYFPTFSDIYETNKLILMIGHLSCYTQCTSCRHTNYEFSHLLEAFWGK